MKKILCCIVLLSLLVGCGEEERIENIYSARVDHIIYTRGGDYQLAELSGVKTFPLAPNRGFGGLLVINNPFSVDETSLFAYDLACPYERDPKITISVNSNIQAECQECGSIFNIVDGRGSKISGPGNNQNLQIYRVVPMSGRPGDFRVINR